MANEIYYSASTWLCLRNRLSRRRTTVGSTGWRTRLNPGDTFSRENSSAFRILGGGRAAITLALLVRNFRPRLNHLRLDRLRSLTRCFRLLCQCPHSHRSVGDVHVDHSYRANLVRLWLGNTAPRDGISIDFSLSIARWSTFPEMPTTTVGHLAFSLARFSHYDWSRADQIAGRSLLA